MSYICFSFFELLQRRKKDWDAQIGKMPDYRRKPFFNDDARMVLIVEGGCLKTAYGAGFLKGLDDSFGVEFHDTKSILHLVDEVVVISGGAPVALASASGKLDKAPDIFKILTSHEFFSPYRMAKAELMPQRLGGGKSKTPPIDLNFAMKALEHMGMNFDAFNELGINATYLVTHAETGARIAIRNPEGDLTTFAPRASMTIPFMAGDPLDHSGTYVHDGGFSHDPSGYQYAVEVMNASHVLCASNNHQAHISRDEGATFRIICRELKDRPGALNAYMRCDERMRQIHEDAADGTIRSTIHNGNLISNSSGLTLRLETTFPEEHSTFDRLELRASELVRRIATGYENAECIANHYLHGIPLPEMLARPYPTAEELVNPYTAFASASSSAFWAVPAAVANMTAATTRFGVDMATIGMRNIPFWGSMGGPSPPPDSTPQ
ncbi:MAG: hypothetical protein K2Q32_08340 [Alphaproteobacteria bacterium]|nr:hypothetical protein [Alphaproteobacteria bacterium]